MKQILATLLSFILSVVFVAAVFGSGIGLAYAIYRYWHYLPYMFLTVLIIGFAILFYGDMRDFIDNKFRR